MESVTITYGPKGFWRRLWFWLTGPIRRWRERRCWLGKTIVVNGIERTIIDYDPKRHILTIDRPWGEAPDPSDASKFII